MRRILAILGTVVFVSAAHADNWPGWRGPQQSGLSAEVVVPLHWNDTENIHWKIPIPGVGHSSPIVWENAIFVTAAVSDDLTRRVIRVDRDSGQVVWDRTVAVAPFEEMHRDNSPASSTPVTDGKLVYCSFCVEGRILVAALTFDGEIVWQSYPGTFASQHGYCTGLVLDEDRLFLSGLQDGEDAFVAALNGSTGETIWKTKRGRNIRSFSTPFLCEVDEQPAILLSGAEQTVAYARSSGEALFEVEGPASKTVSSIVACPQSQLAFVCGGRDDRLIAIKLRCADSALSTNDAEARVSWRESKAVPYMNSPLACNGLLHVLSDAGVYRCYKASTGEVLNERRAVGATKASMVATQKHIYIPEESGRVTIIANDASWQVVAKNEIEGEIVASPAISNGDLILRTKDHLVLIRENL